MRFLFILLIPVLLSSCKDSILMEETVYEGRKHILVKTKTLDYYYDLQGGGFSRIVDREGKDWVGFKMEPWGDYPASAASSFRGLPNLVFQGEDDGAGHPGHDKCTSRVEGKRIITGSLSGLWKWTWEFYDDHAVLEIQKTDPDRSYWFLYEGTPGGSFDPLNSYFGTNRGGPHPGAQDYYKGEILRHRFRWMYAGSTYSAATFYMVQEQEDDFMDMVSFLGNTESGLESPDGMTVFGFGRDEGARALLQDPQRFIIGLFPERIEDQNDHLRLVDFIESEFLK
jgi:hypothetical protein